MFVTFCAKKVFSGRFILLFLLSTTVCFAQDLPKGWQLPPARLMGQEFRKKDPRHFLVATGDFNGDGVQDKALLLFMDGPAPQLGFFICIKTVSGCRWHSIEVMDAAFFDVMGIDTVKAGKTQTDCGKGYNCTAGEPDVLNLKHDAVEFFKDESASSVYFYDSKTHHFKSVPTSD